MPRIFWTIRRKTEIAKLSKQKTPQQLARYYGKPVDEIEYVLRQIQPATGMVKSVDIVCGIRITKYHAAYAFGADIQSGVGVKNHIYRVELS